MINITEKINQEEFKNDVLKVIKPFNPFFVSVCGEYMYGFPSKKATVEINGSYAIDKEGLLNFWDKNIDTIKESIKFDITAYELHKYTKMLTNGENGYIIEQIFSPLTIYQSEIFDEYKECVQKFYLTKKLYNYYNDFSVNLLNKLTSQKEKKINDLINLFRSLLTGIHLFESQQLVTNIVQLDNEHFHLSYISELINLKITDKKYQKVDNINFFLDEASKLIERLELSSKESTLPDNVRNKYKLYRLVSEFYYIEYSDINYDSIRQRDRNNKIFISKSKEKLLLESKPFINLEHVFEINISPKYIVFVPDFYQYFSSQEQFYLGKNIEFIDIETFLLKLKKSDPLIILTLFNPYPIFKSPILDELIENKDKILTRQFYTNSKNLIERHYEKMLGSLLDEEYYQNVMMTFSILFALIEWLETDDIKLNFENKNDFLTNILSGNLTIEALKLYYNELITKIDNLYLSKLFEYEEPDCNFITNILKKIKTKHWEVSIND